MSSTLFYLINRAVEMTIVHIPSVRYILTVRTTQIEKFRVWGENIKEEEAAIRRRRALRRVDRELERGNYTAALSLVKQLKAHPAGLLRGFGAGAPQVPRSASDELKLVGGHKMSSLQSVVDAILHSIKRGLEFQLEEEETKILQQDFEKAMDTESYDSIYEDHLICSLHEAGHFLVGYMLGVFPRRYKVPSVEDLFQDKFASGKVEFVGFEFLRDVGLDTVSNNNFSRKKPNNETLKKFLCVAIGGLAAEHLQFGYSELLHSDVVKLDRVVKWLGLTENEVDSLTRQAAEVAILILSWQNEAKCSLAVAMALGRSVGLCIETIERTLKFNEL